MLTKGWMLLECITSQRAPEGRHAASSSTTQQFKVVVMENRGCSFNATRGKQFSCNNGINDASGSYLKLGGRSTYSTARDMRVGSPSSSTRTEATAHRARNRVVAVGSCQLSKA